jgi:hypothetical protein
MLFEKSKYSAKIGYFSSLLNFLTTRYRINIEAKQPVMEATISLISRMPDLFDCLNS